MQKKKVIKIVILLFNIQKEDDLYSWLLCFKENPVV